MSMPLLLHAAVSQLTDIFGFTVQSNILLPRLDEINPQIHPFFFSFLLLPFPGSVLEIEFFIR